MESSAKRVVGTVVPLFSLWSGKKSGEPTVGTVDCGFLFLDWLSTTGQHAWQLLPLSEGHLEEGSSSTHVPSPYKGYGVGLDPRYLSGEWGLLEPSDDVLARFRAEEKQWIEDYAIFCALRDDFGTDDWRTWEPALRDADADAVTTWSAAHDADVRAHIVTQWRLHAAFRALREKAASLDIEFIGDLPFYVPLQSPLVWANQGCFDIGPGAVLERMSGIPDGPKSHFGRQVWGHPLYAWQMPDTKERIIKLWEIRMAYFARFYDTMRLDHAKGLFHYGAMDAEDPKKDMILDGPGASVLEHLVLFGRKIGLQLFAEDAGDRLEELRETLVRLEVPGIRILRFAYNEKRKAVETDYSDIANYPSNAYAYTSTHDTIPLMAYVRVLSEEEQRHLCVHVGVTYTDDEELLAMRLRDAVIHSPALHGMIALQDWLLVEERINVPGTEKAIGDPNWRYRTPVPIEELPHPQFR